MGGSGGWNGARQERGFWSHLSLSAYFVVRCKTWHMGGGGECTD